MLKVFSLIKRRDDLSLDEFRTWILEQHAPMGRELPGLREYHVSVVEQDGPDLPYHAVTELYFDDEDAFKAAFASDAGLSRLPSANSTSMPLSGERSSPGMTITRTWSPCSRQRRVT